MRSHVTWSLLAIIALAAAPLSSQDGAFEETAQVVEVQVPVHVTDRSGRPLRGLTRDDFQIFDERKRREILRFEVIDLEALEVGSSRTAVENALEGSARRHFLLLFDLSFSDPNSVVRARLAAREFVLDNLHPTDLVAVGTHSAERGGRLLVTFTTDRAQVARAIDGLESPHLLRFQPRDPLSFLFDDPGAGPLRVAADAATLAPGSRREPSPTGMDPTHSRPQGPSWVLGQEMNKARRSESAGRVASWARSLAELARMLDSAKGRKHVVYFSEGFDGELLFGRELAMSNVGVPEDQNSQMLNRHWSIHGDDRYASGELLNQVGRMLEAFRRTDCVLQTVDISAGSTEGAGGASRRTSRDTLFYMAGETGGRLVESAAGLAEQLTEVLEGTSVTYLLTFVANDLPADGSYRRLKVKAALPRGGRISTRHGYYAPRPYEQLHPLERSLLASDAIVSGAPASEIPIALFSVPFRASESLAYVPVIIEVPGAPLLAGQVGSRLAAELFAYVTDERGEIRDFFSQLVSLDLSGKREDFSRSGIKYYGHLDLPPGDYLLRVLVRNAETGRFGLETMALAIPDFQQAQPFLLKPIFVESERNWVLIREKQSEPATSVVYPFTVRGDPFIPAARPALQPREKIQLCLVAYNLGEGELKVDGSVLGEDGSIVDGGRLGSVKRTLTGIRGLDKVLAKFEPRGLGVGSYTLRIALTDPATGSIEVGSIPFSIRD